MKPRTGKRLKIRNLIDSNDTRISLSQFCGKVILLGFWSPDCGPSRVESRYENILMKTFEKLKIQDNVVFIKIGGDVNFAQWKNYIKSNPQVGIQLYYQKNIFSFLKNCKVSSDGLPQYWIIDEKCNILGTNVATPEEFFLLDYMLIQAFHGIPCSISCQTIMYDWPKETSSSLEMRKLYYDLKVELEDVLKTEKEIMKEFNEKNNLNYN